MLQSSDEFGFSLDHFQQSQEYYQSLSSSNLRSKSSKRKHKSRKHKHSRKHKNKHHSKSKSSRLQKKHSSKVYGSIDDQCSVCLDNAIKLDTRLLPCKHAFHGQCLIDWVRQGEKFTCPLCRQEISHFFQLSNNDEINNELVSIWNEYYISGKSNIDLSSNKNKNENNLNENNLNKTLNIELTNNEINKSVSDIVSQLLLAPKVNKVKSLPVELEINTKQKSKEIIIDASEDNTNLVVELPSITLEPLYDNSNNKEHTTRFSRRSRECTPKPVSRDSSLLAIRKTILGTLNSMSNYKEKEKEMENECRTIRENCIDFSNLNASKCQTEPIKPIQCTDINLDELKLDMKNLEKTASITSQDFEKNSFKIEPKIKPSCLQLPFQDELKKQLSFIDKYENSNAENQIGIANSNEPQSMEYLSIWESMWSDMVYTTHNGNTTNKCNSKFENTINHLNQVLNIGSHAFIPLIFNNFISKSLNPSKWNIDTQNVITSSNDFQPQSISENSQFARINDSGKTNYNLNLIKKNVQIDGYRAIYEENKNKNILKQTQDINENNNVVYTNENNPYNQSSNNNKDILINCEAGIYAGISASIATYAVNQPMWRNQFLHVNMRRSLFPLMGTTIPNVAAFFTIYEHLKSNAFHCDPTEKSKMWTFGERFISAGIASSIAFMYKNKTPLRMLLPLRFAAFFGGFELCKDITMDLKHTNGNYTNLNLFEVASAATIGGIIASGIHYPTTQLIPNLSNSLSILGFSTINNIGNINHGFNNGNIGNVISKIPIESLYRGWLSQLTRFLPPTVVCSCAFEFGKRAINQRQNDEE